MKRLSVILSIILCLILVFGPIKIFIDTIFPKTIDNEVTRLHMNTGNTTRLSYDNPEDLALGISNILYPSIDYNTRPDGLIILQSDNWNDVLSILPLMSKYNSPIIPVGREISGKIINYINNTIPKGIKKLDDTQLILISNNTNELGASLNSIDYKKEYVSYLNTEDLQNKISVLPGILDDTQYGFIVNDKEPLMAIPVGSWLVHNKNSFPLFINDKGEIYNSSRNILSNNEIKKLYVLGNEEIRDSLDLKDIDIEYLTSNNPEKLSIDFAKYYDIDTFVGWNATDERRDSGHNFILASKKEPLMAIIGTQLSFTGKVGPLLWTEGKSLSKIVEGYLWSLKPNFWITPAEGPYNHIWILGDNSILNYGIQGRVDYTQEIESYEMMGEGGVSGLDLLSILWVLASLGCSLWVTFHVFFRMVSLFILTKMMWILITLILGPVGLWLYVISYKDRPFMKMMDNVMWKRPLWNQVAVATIMGLSFGGATMIATAYIVASLGMPLIPISSPKLFLLGNPMILQMIIVYIVAFILNFTVFMPTMLMRMKNISYNIGVKESLPVVFISMTSVSIGMMTSMWWLHMVYSPMMPEETHILWWGFMSLATLIGGIIAFIPNWRLVRYGKKMGVS